MEKSTSSIAKKFKEMKKNCLINLSEFLDNKTFMNFCFTRTFYKKLLRMDLKIVKLYKLFSIKSKVEFIREKLRYVQQNNPKISRTDDLILKYLTSNETLEFLKNRFKYSNDEILNAGKLYLLELLEENSKVVIYDIKYLDTLMDLKEVYDNYWKMNINFMINSKNEYFSEEVVNLRRIDTFEIPSNAYSSASFNQKCEKILTNSKNNFFINKLIIEAYHNEATIDRLINLKIFVNFFLNKPNKLEILKLSMMCVSSEILEHILKIIELNTYSLKKVYIEGKFLEKEKFKELIKKLRKCENLKSISLDKLNYEEKKFNYLSKLKDLRNTDKINLFISFENDSRYRICLKNLSELFSKFKNTRFKLKIKLQIEKLNRKEDQIFNLLELISIWADDVLEKPHSFNIFNIKEIRNLCKNNSNSNLKIRVKLYIDFAENTVTGYHIKLLIPDKINKLRVLNFNTHRKYEDLKDLLSSNLDARKVSYINNCKSFGILSKDKHFTLKLDRYDKDDFDMLNVYLKNNLINGKLPSFLDSFSLYFFLHGSFDYCFFDKTNWQDYQLLSENIKYLNVLPQYGFTETSINDVLRLASVIETFVNLEFISFDYNIINDKIWIEFSKCLKPLKKLKFLYFLFNSNNKKIFEKFNDEVAVNFIENISTCYINFISLRGTFTNVTLESFKKNIHKFKYLTEFNIKGVLNIDIIGIELIDYILEKTNFIANMLLDIEFLGNDNDVIYLKNKMKALEDKYNRTFTINYISL